MSSLFKLGFQLNHAVLVLLAPVLVFGLLLGLSLELV